MLYRRFLLSFEFECVAMVKEPALYPIFVVGGRKSTEADDDRCLMTFQLYGVRAN